MLGTWNGRDGETWNKDTSTFLQVLVSIQSLILVEDPYFNEPGWERQMHSLEGKKKSLRYNDLRRYKTLQYAINGQIENPPEEFKDVVKKHFMMKKDEIIDTVNIWMEESISYKEQLKKELDRFKENISKIDLKVSGEDDTKKSSLEKEEVEDDTKMSPVEDNTKKSSLEKEEVKDYSKTSSEEDEEWRMKSEEKIRNST